MRRAVRALLVAVSVGGVLFLFVLPGRTWIEQSRSTSQAEHRLQILSAENAALSTRIGQLHDPTYIKQVAREQYGLVMPGERAYGILPPSTTTTLPSPGNSP